MIARIDRGLAEEDSQPPDVEDFGFHHPFQMVEMVVAVLKRSDFTCWPDQGGFLDQEMTWIEDVFTYMALERREKWANDHERMEYEDGDFKPLSLDELG